MTKVFIFTSFCFMTKVFIFTSFCFIVQLVESQVSALNVYTCDGEAVDIQNLPSNQVITLEIPRSHNEVRNLFFIL